MNNSLLTPQQVAEMLGVTEGTLSVWRCTGRYPLRFVKVGRRVMYRQTDIDAFIDGRVYEHTL
ncbi:MULTISPECIES: helix-turn-helix domain-containing protein [Shewanella]|jgi:excisionase family DNA binding protein|uniref:Helix-turn-helix domain-containing protein n=2 Tax=Shewanella TaxID=22 RepID=A0ABT2FJC1_9GAMM|nr:MULTISPECIES: helix-turn-helix domain-containing protein [Shewanella]MCH1924538.1 helix-turn-helix domain-containing protein [Shewanella electrica]MCL1073971.1 helix-turn-helix domain-containing protein [Shewanella dokdonensis]MCS4556439.1 helix-turn-helix domain-containing protein [Shewanella electrica]QVK23732.1 helix-turn-helix domain-containing protein [Shewanella dokdonensis]